LRVRVRFLAAAADAAGRRAIELEVSEGARLADLVEQVYRIVPGLRELAERIPLIILVNGVKRGDDYVLSEGDEVAFMPPAGGG